MYNPPPPSTTTASGSTKSSRIMVCMWCHCSARAFPLMAVYGLSYGMLPTSAATAFSMVSVTNGKDVTAGTPARTPCRNPFLRWNPLLEPLLEPLPALEPPSSGRFQRTLPALEPLPAPLPAPHSSTAPPPLFCLSLSLRPPPQGTGIGTVKRQGQHFAMSYTIFMCGTPWHHPFTSVQNQRDYNNIPKFSMKACI